MNLNPYGEDRNLPAKFPLHDMINASGSIEPPWISKLFAFWYERVSHANKKQQARQTVAT